MVGRLAFLSMPLLLLGLHAAEEPIHVFPGGDIQAAIEQAAARPTNKIVKIHEGIYRPQHKAQAFIFLNRKHDGVQLEAIGNVTLTAQNQEIADKSLSNFPAIVNHVVYFGDGISSNTLLRGFKITGANNFVTDQPAEDAIEPNLAFFDKSGGAYGRAFFFTDGGAIKIFGRSYPVIDTIEIYDCFSNPCAGGISIEHRGFVGHAVTITNCVFRNNRSAVTGSAIDLLTGSAAKISNCLFVGNISNTRTNYVPVPGNIAWPNPQLFATTFNYMKTNGCGALTVFAPSIATVDHCTFTGNFNGVDDRGPRSSYRNCIFWQNNAKGGIRPGGRYEMAVDTPNVIGCFLHGDTDDLRGTISHTSNQLACPDPMFDANFIPQNPVFANAGRR